jgi:large conductance mechanosensitive channel
MTLSGPLSAAKLKGRLAPTLAAAKEAGAATINYGMWLNTVIDFVIVAFAIFLVVQQMNKLKKKEEAAPAAPPAPSKEELLLGEIRDLLKARS